MVKISDRLKTAASLIREGAVLADVGTDHGYVPIYLLEQKKIKSAIAMDINKGPLERAREHIHLYGMDAYIQTRLSDGVAALEKGEADSILVAGMGGGLVMHILEEGKDICQAAGELILQPQSELCSVREYLAENGYVTEAERMVFEDGKYYPMMRVHYQAEKNEDADKAIKAGGINTCGLSDENWLIFASLGIHYHYTNLPSIRYMILRTQCGHEKNRYSPTQSKKHKKERKC